MHRGLRNITLAALGVFCWLACDGYEYRYYQKETTLLQGVCISTVCGSHGRGDPALCLEFMRDHYHSAVAVGCYNEVHAFYACVTALGCVDDWEAACPAQAAALATCQGAPECTTSGTTYLIGEEWLAASSCNAFCGDTYAHCNTEYGRRDCYCSNLPSTFAPDAGITITPAVQFSTPSCWTEDFLPAVHRACPDDTR